MNMRVVSWNVAKLLSHDGTAIDTAASLVNFQADLVALQEFPEDPRLLQLISNQLGLPFYNLWAPGENSPNRSGSSLVCLSRFRISHVTRIIAHNPNLTAQSKSGISMISHEKGALVCGVDAPNGRVTFASTHLLPFHAFNRSADEPEFLAIWTDLLEKVLAAGPSPRILAGDYNSSMNYRLNPNSILQDANLTSSLKTRVTRPSGQSHDDVLVDGVTRIAAVQVLPSASDHHVCVVDLTMG